MKTSTGYFVMAGVFASLSLLIMFNKNIKPVTYKSEGLNHAVDCTDIATDSEIDSVIKIYCTPFQK